MPSSNHVPSYLEVHATCRDMIGEGLRLGQFSSRQQRVVKDFIVKQLKLLIKHEPGSRIDRKTLKAALHIFAPPLARTNSLTFAIFTAANIAVVFDEHWYKEIYWVTHDELKANLPKLESIKNEFLKEFDDVVITPSSGQKRKEPSNAARTEVKAMKSVAAPSEVVVKETGNSDGAASSMLQAIPSTPAKSSSQPGYAATQSFARQPDVSKLTYEILPSMQVVAGSNKPVPGIIFHFNCSGIFFQKFQPRFQTVFKEYSNGFQWKSTLMVSASIRPNQGWLTLGEPLSSYSATVEIDLTGMHPNTKLIPEDPARQQWLVGTVVLETDPACRGGIGVFVPTARDVIAQARGVSITNATKPMATIEPLSDVAKQAMSLPQHKGAPLKKQKQNAAPAKKPASPK